MPIRKNRAFQRIVYGAVGDPKDRVLLARSGDRKVKHTRPFGARDAFSRGVMAIVSQAGDDVKRMVAEDEELKIWFWEAMRTGVKLGDQTSMRLYSEILKLVGEKQEFIVLVLKQLGMTDISELERMVETHRDHAGVTPAQRAAVCADYLEMYVNANPVERGAFVRRLGGEVVQRSDSVVEVLGEPRG